MATDRVGVPKDLSHIPLSKLAELRLRLVASKQDIEAQLGVDKHSDKKHDRKWRINTIWAKRCIENDIAKIKIELAIRQGKKSSRPSYMPLFSDLLDAIANNDKMKIIGTAKTMRDMLDTHYME